jgi:hypothetical protein
MLHALAHAIPRRLAAAALAAAGVGLLGAPATASAAKATKPAITTRGVSFVTQAGRPVVLRGVNISYHFPHPELVSQLGANFVRLRVLWSEIEPQRDVFDPAQLAELDAAVHYYNAHGIAIELDLRGSGVPAWFGSTQGFWATNAAASQAAYKPFVRTIVNRYHGYRYVVGYGIFNEPHPFGASGHSTHRSSRLILRWQAAIRDQIMAHDPYRVVFFSVRGGNYGIKYANFAAAGFRLTHAVYDWHSFFNGLHGSGMDAANENWVPSWVQTHNQANTDYHGTLENQRKNIGIAWARTRRLGIPMIVGEWGIRNDDAHWDAYDSQLATIFTARRLSWARWDMDYQEMGLLTGSGLNAQGQWLKSYLTEALPAP